MQMGFRWYGEDNDKISLADIKQIPGVTSIVWALHHKLPGEVWTVEEIAEVQKQLEPYGFNMDVVESVNVHDDIKIGLPSRDQYIENYIQTIKNLSKFGVKVICYNFMPIFDWTRTDLFHPVGDGSTALYYEAGKIHDDPKEMADYILNNLHGMTFPGWEPERMEKLDELFAAYKPVTKEVLWENLKYFLEALMPTCKECDIKMAIHMDDPPWDIFGLPRLLTCEENIDRFLKMVDSPYNCLTLCSGSLNADPRNNVADIVRKHCDRIAFAHIRNVKHFPNGDFSEASHRDCDGDTRILDILKAYHDCGFEGYIRPDHGRHLWDEKPGNVRPGYGLYDRRNADKAVSVDAPLSANNPYTLLDILNNPDVKIADDTLNIEMMKKKMAESIADLLPREKEIITKFYGIGVPKETMAEIAEDMGLKRERVRQIRNLTIRRLNRSIRHQALRNYFKR